MSLRVEDRRKRNSRTPISAYGARMSSYDQQDGEPPQVEAVMSQAARFRAVHHHREADAEQETRRS